MCHSVLCEVKFSGLTEPNTVSTRSVAAFPAEASSVQDTQTSHRTDLAGGKQPMVLELGM
jgi:hypothetical protein